MAQISKIVTFPQQIRLIELDSTTSTNDDAKKLADQGARHLTLVSARHQQKGRGRIGRDWISPPGNIYASLLVRPTSDWPDLAHISHITALAIHETIHTLLPQCRVTLKWPNDVLVEGQKISGVLIETAGLRQQNQKLTSDWLVIGIGINVATHPQQHMQYPVTSLAHQGGPSDPAAVLPLLAHQLVTYLDNWSTNGFAALKEKYLSHAHDLGQIIKISHAGKQISGRYKTINTHGHIVIEMADGRLTTVSAGDILINT